MFLVRHRRLRRATGIALIALGALLMWLAPEVAIGLVLLFLGLALEVAGITLERAKRR
jgi:hypothetical protein